MVICKGLSGGGEGKQSRVRVPGKRSLCVVVVVFVHA